MENKIFEILENDDGYLVLKNLISDREINPYFDEKCKYIVIDKGDDNAITVYGDYAINFGFKQGISSKYHTNKTNLLRQKTIDFIEQNCNVKIKKAFI